MQDYSNPQSARPISSIHINIAKGLASCLVILGHAIHQTSLQQINPDAYWFLFRFVFSSTMSVFFIISGYLWSISKPITFSAQVKKDARSLLYPFLTLSIIFELLLLGSGIETVDHIKKAATAVLLFQSDSANLPSGVLWFLFSLFCFRQIAYITRKTNYSAILNISIIIAGSALTWFIYPFPFLALDRLHYYAFFFIGASPIIRNFFIQNRKMLTTTTFVILCSAASFLATYFRTTLVEKIIVIAKLPSIFGVPALFSSVYRFSSWPAKVFDHIGRNSVFPYVFHMPVFTVIKIAAPGYIKDSPLIYSSILTVISIIACQLIGSIFLKIPLLYKLVFGKQPRQ